MVDIVLIELIGGKYCGLFDYVVVGVFVMCCLIVFVRIDGVVWGV